MMTSSALRKQYPRFFYRSFQYLQKKDGLHISFVFEMPPDISFRPTIILKGVTAKEIRRVGESALNNLAFHLGLVEMISYWKATASPEIIVEAGSLNKNQIQWFKDLILKGMGEYFFQNKINFTQPQRRGAGFTKKDFLTITSTPREKLNLIKSENLMRLSLQERTLVPVGGGKDAVVTLELLKKAGMDITPFVLNPKPEQKRILALAQTKKPIAVQRTIDPKLLELNRKGYLNGHTPFSAYLAFLSFLCAALFGYKYIALSNERSSNEGNVKYRGKMINHQYSKAFEFEKKFREYTKKYLSKNIEYFSFLRPLYELQIAKIFSSYPKYFPAFLSCNEAHKTKSGKRKPTGTWCGQCAKCLFVFLAICPFAGEQETKAIFKKDLLKDKKLKNLMDELTGKRRFKPFECVGTTRESAIALALCQGKISDHPLLHMFTKQHFLPKRFEQILKNSL